jgi:threonylcarbamoyladenosine tRNA methylthiotransferase MtaB
MKISFYTLGCRTNQSETESMMAAFEKDRWELVPFGNPAEVCVVHTCCVTARSDMKVRQTIRKIIKGQPEIKVVVAGCSVHLHREIFAKIPGVALTLDNSEKEEILQKVKAVCSEFTHPDLI